MSNDENLNESNESPQNEPLNSLIAELKSVEELDSFVLAEINKDEINGEASKCLFSQFADTTKKAIWESLFKTCSDQTKQEIGLSLIKQCNEETKESIGGEFLNQCNEKTKKKIYSQLRDIISKRRFALAYSRSDGRVKEFQESECLDTEIESQYKNCLGTITNGEFFPIVEQKGYNKSDKPKNFAKQISEQNYKFKSNWLKAKTIFIRIILFLLIISAILILCKIIQDFYNIPTVFWK